MNYILQLDYQIFKFINVWTGHWLFFDYLAIFMAVYSIFIIAGIIAIWWLKLPKTKSSKLWPMVGKRKWLIFGTVAGASVVAELINQILGFIKFRQRPFLSLNIHQLIGHLPEKSFPSDHAAVAFAASMAVYFYNKKLGAVLFTISFLMSLARIYVGAHYPLDILVGMFLGICIAYVSYKLFFCKLDKGGKLI